MVWVGFAEIDQHTTLDTFFLSNTRFFRFQNDALKPTTLRYALLNNDTPLHYQPNLTHLKLNMNNINITDFLTYAKTRWYSLVAKRKRASNRKRIENQKRLAPLNSAYLIRFITIWQLQHFCFVELFLFCNIFVSHIYKLN